MHLSKARYVTFCQQLLALACVLALAVAAGSVLTLDIVAPAPGGRDVVPAVTQGDAYVSTGPITPKVRQVAVKGVATSAPDGSRSAKTPQQTAPSSPGFKVVALSRPEAVSGFATVGVTWALGDHFGERQIKVFVRTLNKGVWSAWSKLEYHDDHGPNAGSAESRHERAGTEPTVVGHVQKVQMRAETVTGRAPRGLGLALIDPGADRLRKAAPAINTAYLGHRVSDTTGAGQPGGGSTGGPATGTPASGNASIALSAMKVAPKPQIFSRAQWGANEHLRDQGPPQYGTIKTGFVHHTVNANDYTRDQVPALIRSIYAYHVVSKGWRDIGYNFLVDRFGRIWEGRYGGVDRPVVGAHTLGYNEVSFAMSSIGNFQIASPPQAILDAYASLFAWKLSMYNIVADATHLWVKDRYMNAINGHRDVNGTECPGTYLYAKIPGIRAAAARIQVKGGPTPTPTPTP
ncbi:MAG: peptidoglycan recognition protein, partial [Actinomycetota bacterium]|nr:peptidoglycan recognition protein [Actinomycetota bacterium]